MLRCQSALDKVDATGDEQIGVNIVRKAVEAPLRQLVENAGLEGAIIVEQVRKGKASSGYNVATGKYTDLIKDGVLDPAKVARTALQNAASIAGLLITTECMITELPEEEKAMPGGPGGPPDMGGMY